MDVSRQVDYWRAGSKDDFEAAEVLLEKGKTLQALFFAHLSLEKMLKAHITRTTSDVPPRTHNLAQLSVLSRLDLTSEQREFLKRFNVFQLEGRYPDQLGARPPAERAKQLLSQAKETLEWLTQKLCIP